MRIKKIIFLVLLNIFIFDAFSMEMGSFQENDVILIRHFYELSNTKESTIRIYKNNSQVESIVLPPITDEDKNNSFMELQKVLQKYISEGYIIVTSNAVASSIKNTTIYILQKK